MRVFAGGGLARCIRRAHCWAYCIVVKGASAQIAFREGSSLYNTTRDLTLIFKSEGVIR